MTDTTGMTQEEIDRAAALRKKRTFKKFTFRGVELDKLLDLSLEEFAQLVHARARRRMFRGLKRNTKALLDRLRKAKKSESRARARERPRARARGARHDAGDRESRRLAGRAGGRLRG